jgi:hypothetical protein
MHELFVVSINLCFLQYLRFLTWYVTCLFVNCHDYKSLWSQQPLLLLRKDYLCVTKPIPIL